MMIQPGWNGAKRVLSISGGKDSTAMLLHALEHGYHIDAAVFADTGLEHELTHEYLDYLERVTGVSIQRVSADFSKQIARKRETIANKWPEEWKQPYPGYWSKAKKTITPKPDWQPSSIYQWQRHGDWIWQAARPPLNEEEIEKALKTALDILHPSGNPFLDLCLWKGRFPSQGARFCTDELKRDPIMKQVVIPMQDKGFAVDSWQGIRWEESPKRATDNMVACQGGGYTIYRPIIHWNVEKVIATHKRHGVKPNPLYTKGCNRVGCLPCINVTKAEMAEIARRYPEQIDKLTKWERLVGLSSKRGISSFFAVDKIPGPHQINHGLKMPNVQDVARWAMTGKGGYNIDMFTATEEPPQCSSSMGLCDSPTESVQWIQFAENAA
ncbi:phosphoadenosine phosphosulfate reductase domain-containing protein [Magnetococcus sp. PR-3]|uniref:phosphoadenosine phosphosulfate reductase domain-containing protein n=1 Tax=Magnetococcus sp. PR-3 TaxID=3120355 RepID=UPI002FCE0B82